MNRLDRRFCPFRHTEKDDALVWVRGDETRVEVIHQANGSGIAVKLRCENCRNLTGALPKSVWLEWFDPFDPNVVVRINEDFDKEPCSYKGCTATNTEWHHFAPYNTFGSSANDWPVMPLCRAHHVEWHQRMDGYRWHRRGGAA